MTNRESIQKMGLIDLASFIAETMDCKECPVKDCNSRPIACVTKIKMWLEKARTQILKN